MEREKKAPRPEEVKARIKQLVQQTLQEALEAELEDDLGYPKNGKAPSDNTHNGYSEKTIRTDTWDLCLKVPRDRKSDFEPQLIRKRQTVLDDPGRQDRRPVCQGDDHPGYPGHPGRLDGTALSPSLISRLTDRVLPRLEE